MLHLFRQAGVEMSTAMEGNVVRVEMGLGNGAA
jgi:hypothetical protein